jgi:tetratricopeptide (TPR) repeat protein
MRNFWRLLVWASIVTVLTACAAAGVVATHDPAKKLRAAIELFDYAGRPLPAEKLVVDAIAQYQAAHDVAGLGDAYRVYGMFFGSRSVAATGYQQHYSEKGFLDPSATWEGRYTKSIEYLRKSEALLIQTDRLDLLSNVYYHMAEDFVLMHDLGNACNAFGQSLQANTEFHRRHPATELDLSKGYRSFDDAIATAKRTTGCRG